MVIPVKEPLKTTYASQDEEGGEEEADFSVPSSPTGCPSDSPTIGELADRR
jgi:hypothetical protein